MSRDKLEVALGLILLCAAGILGALLNDDGDSPLWTAWVGVRVLVCVFLLGFAGWFSGLLTVALVSIVKGKDSTERLDGLKATGLSACVIGVLVLVYLLIVPPNFLAFVAAWLVYGLERIGGIYALFKGRES